MMPNSKLQAPDNIPKYRRRLDSARQRLDKFNSAVEKTDLAYQAVYNLNQMIADLAATSGDQIQVIFPNPKSKTPHTLHFDLAFGQEFKTLLFTTLETQKVRLALEYQNALRQEKPFW